MKVVIWKRANAHRDRVKAFMDFLKRKGHSCRLCIGKTPPPCDVAFVFNGLHVREKNIVKHLRDLGTQVFYMEVGSFPQRGHYVVGRNPCVAGGMLQGEEIPPVTPADELMMQTFFDKYSKGANMDLPREQVSGFLQLERDYAIRSFSKFKRTQQVVNKVEELYPDEKVVWKVHPGDRAPKIKVAHKLYRGGTIWIHVAMAKVCVAVNSTTLLESALAGRPVVALGDSPLNRPEGPRAVVREILRRQISIRDKDPTEQIERSIGKVV
jgi:hypothetical protein|tara:strand:- start:351 stop:1151 length:801 start_codon:yes stop_codon:yes gene_type:complete